MTGDLRQRFHELHATGLFVMPNSWDVGSARLLATLGFPALAVTRDELLAHAASLAAAVEVPLSVDAERCFADDPDGVADTVRLIARTGAAGCSIEDYDPVSGTIDPADHAAERVAAAAGAARPHGLVLTARAENHLYGVDDLDDTIARLRAYRDAGADVVYAPGLVDLGDIARVVRDVAVAVNVLALPGGPSTSELAEVGVRRVSTGGALLKAAYGSLVSAGRELFDAGTSTYAANAITNAELRTAFSPP